MPATMTKITKGKNKGKYKVSTPNMVHAKATTKDKAEHQRNLLFAVDHGWTPDGMPSKKKMKVRIKRMHK